MISFGICLYCKFYRGEEEGEPSVDQNPEYRDESYYDQTSVVHTNTAYNYEGEDTIATARTEEKQEGGGWCGCLPCVGPSPAVVEENELYGAGQEYEQYDQDNYDTRVVDSNYRYDGDMYDEEDYE